MKKAPWGRKHSRGPMGACRRPHGATITLQDACGWTPFIIPSMLGREITDGILTIRMAHGKASALDREICLALQSAFEEAATDDAVGAVVLTGTGSIFSAGVDLPRMISAGGDYVQDFVEALDAALRGLFVFPKPVVAAVNGHAIAGGAILAFACDHRLMCAGRIGVPEMLVGVPFPPM